MIITKRKFYSRLSTVLFLLGTLFIIAIYAYLLSKSPQVQASGNYQNAELADHALTFVDQHASKACQGVPTIANGECKTFVNCIVYAVSGRTQRTYPGYHEGFRNAGGVSVNRSDTVRGDIIQVGNSDLERPLHTAIILHRNGDGSFRVVDSNSHGRIIEGVWVGDGIVRERNYNPPANARFWRMGKAERPVIGSLDMIRRAPGGIRAAGWSIDQDTPASNEVHLYSGDGEVKPSSNPGRQLTANQFRQDIGNVYPQYGAHHGFDGTVAARNAGHQRVCAYGINVPGTPGSNRQLGCKDIHISPDPYGYVDSIQRVSGGIRVQGWTIDPDTASPITVHVYGGNGAPSTPSNAFTYGVANTSRPDVARHYPDYGDKHGFSLLLPTNSNPQTVCVYAINNGAGGHNPQLGCRRV